MFCFFFLQFYLFIDWQLLDLHICFCTTKVVQYYNAFTFMYLIPLHMGTTISSHTHTHRSPVNCNTNRVHAHRHTYFQLSHDCRSSTSGPTLSSLLFYGSSICFLISISCSHFPWSVFIIIEQDENACYGSFFRIRSKSS